MMNKQIRYSIVVPVKHVNEYIEEHVRRFNLFTRQDIEIIILPNELSKVPEESNRVRFLLTGKVSPAIKRDIGAKVSNGEYLVFLDDDAFVEESYFSILDSFYMVYPQSATGGPGVTPKNSSLKQKASGAVYEDELLSSDSFRYVSKGKTRKVNDWPSVNFSIPKNLFIEIGGFDENYWPGEDTMLCRKLISFGISIFYNPELIAYHHRRESLIGHMKQVAGYGLHRGHFARLFPENSRRFKYFVPSVWNFYLISLLALMIFIFWFGVRLSKETIVTSSIPAFAYAIALLVAVAKIWKRYSLIVAILAIFYFPLTHIVYGTKFIRGFFSRRPFRSALR